MQEARGRWGKARDDGHRGQGPGLEGEKVRAA
jgi:hypothetical protein